MHEKDPYAICAFVQADLGLHFQLTESMDTVVYVDKQRVSRPDCMDVHAHLNLRCLHMTQGPFSHIAHHLYLHHQHAK